MTAPDMASKINPVTFVATPILIAFAPETGIACDQTLVADEVTPDSRISLEISLLLEV